MPSLKTFLYSLVTILFLIYVVTSGFNFVGIEFASYGNYLLWFVCLILFYFILPSKAGTFFSSDK
jgi:hypothetical protein